MKLVSLLASIAALWCVLGAFVLGPGILMYPLAWGAVFAILFGIHKIFGSSITPPDAMSDTDQPLSGKIADNSLTHDHSAALAR
ncbi:hypothetical protein AB1L30_22270 [Bremerella sp. JC817]|uniref:hypothetical protein n=1 Tax=Bremerella sp. JC817 TaxID=3231756 RepID=UPI00345B35DA